MHLSNKKQNKSNVFYSQHTCFVLESALKTTNQLPFIWSLSLQNHYQKFFLYNMTKYIISTFSIYNNNSRVIALSFVLVFGSKNGPNQNITIKNMSQKFWSFSRFV